MAGLFRKPYLYAASLCVVATASAFAIAGDAIVNGHPTYWVAYGVAASAGMLGIAAAFTRRDAATKVVWSALGSVALIAVAVGAWWSIPLEADEVAVGALEPDGRVTVHTTRTSITLLPTGAVADTGMVFLPGGNVDARAYAHILRPIAEAGHPVAIMKLPLGIAFLAPNRAPTWAAEHSGASRWVVAGHSLGGVVAAGNAASSDDLVGLVLWASYPASDLSDQRFPAVSIYGTNDGLTTPARVDASRSELPNATLFVEIVGAVHGDFGDYGLNPGDGEAAIPHAEAQAQIVEATLEFLSSLG